MLQETTTLSPTKLPTKSARNLDYTLSPTSSAERNDPRDPYTGNKNELSVQEFESDSKSDNAENRYAGLSPIYYVIVSLLVGVCCIATMLLCWMQRHNKFSRHIIDLKRQTSHAHANAHSYVHSYDRVNSSIGGGGRGRAGAAAFSNALERVHTMRGTLDGSGDSLFVGASGLSGAEMDRMRHNNKRRYLSATSLDTKHVHMAFDATSTASTSNDRSSPTSHQQTMSVTMTQSADSPSQTPLSSSAADGKQDAYDMDDDDDDMVEDAIHTNYGVTHKQMHGGANYTAIPLPVSDNADAADMDGVCATDGPQVISSLSEMEVHMVDTVLQRGQTQKHASGDYLYTLQENEVDDDDEDEGEEEEEDEDDDAEECQIIDLAKRMQHYQSNLPQLHAHRNSIIQMLDAHHMVVPGGAGLPAARTKSPHAVTIGMPPPYEYIHEANSSNDSLFQHLPSPLNH